eukprot:3620006-Pyramimonas_sp.AAC.1
MPRRCLPRNPERRVHLRRPWAIPATVPSNCSRLDDCMLQMPRVPPSAICSTGARLSSTSAWSKASCRSRAGHQRISTNLCSGEGAGPRTR